ncbi:hypothetical protein HUG10_04975 [Halorarum halophilum]|uniref:Uncharacterized protein n=1 Tax=Halorarum halophilum TaxID=2743090 RepID=A0A7D5GGN5_9EURY|nr:hypothetical protein [Halobaculum halophilum]QLG26931.1 hypothetical protein HUG10_04975 [Halobaculum halophilum]
MDEAKDELIASLREFGGDALRDAWLFDEETHESLYVREDVERRVADVDVSGYLDNERYGYVTRRTFEELHYTGYNYTVRGFDAFTQFRTFLLAGDRRIGLLASFDPGENYDFDDLSNRIEDLAEGADRLELGGSGG